MESIMNTDLQAQITDTESSANGTNATAETVTAKETEGSVAATDPSEVPASKGSKKKDKSGKRKRRWGDRKDGWRIRTINPMNKVMPFIMPMRCDACNTFAESINVTDSEKFVSDQIISGKDGFSMLHVIVAAYIRTVSQHPALNRFISGQRVYARNDIQVVMTIKKKMSIDSPDTCIKIHFEPTDTIFDVYEKFNKVVMENTAEENEEGSSFDGVMGTLASFPRFFFRFAIWLLNKLDYYGLLPKFLLEVSPFHGSMIITSMGSLGIKPIYHHIYNFGNLPVFVSYGSKRRVNEIDTKGNVTTKRLIDLKIVTDERICDGFQYAAAFRCWKRYMEHPELLIDPPETVNTDID
jgi:hypothetical protein